MSSAATPGPDAAQVAAQGGHGRGRRGFRGGAEK